MEGFPFFSLSTLRLTAERPPLFVAHWECVTLAGCASRMTTNGAGDVPSMTGLYIRRKKRKIEDNDNNNADDDDDADISFV